MDIRFAKYIDSLHPSLECLTTMPPVKASELPNDIPAGGIYLFSERGINMYIGRTNRLRPRILEHGRKSSSHNSAPFAFKLAREATGHVKASYVVDGSRRSLEAAPEFAEAFLRQKARVRAMDVRFVGESDPLRQTLLEVYASFVLNTPYNDFENH